MLCWLSLHSSMENWSFMYIGDQGLLGRAQGTADAGWAYRGTGDKTQIRTESNILQE